jgi:ankyrin repeat protein
MAEEENRSPAPQEAAALLQAALYRFAHDGDLDGVRQVVEKGANVNLWHDQTGLTALHLAVGTNNLALVKYLLETAGADLVPDRSGRWPTIIAAECRVDEALCDYIVEKEAELIQP